jgi:hypothetical protein
LVPSHVATGPSHVVTGKNENVAVASHIKMGQANETNETVTVLRTVKFKEIKGTKIFYGNTEQGTRNTVWEFFCLATFLTKDINAIGKGRSIPGKIWIGYEYIRFKPLQSVINGEVDGFLVWHFFCPGGCTKIQIKNEK